MGATRSLLLIIGIVALLSASPSQAAQEPAILFAPFSGASASMAAIPDGYFEPVALDVDGLFAFPAESKHDLVLPRLETLPVVHDRTRTVDMNGRVTRWEGHVMGRDALQVVFVKGISGMVSGAIDTPAGRVLLGQAGDYIVYKQSRSESFINKGADIPEAFFPRDVDPQSLAKLSKPASAAYPITFNAAGLAKVPLKGEISITLPGAGKFTVVHDNTLPGGLGATTFVGYLKDYGDDFRMVVTYSPSGAQGQVLTPYGTYFIQTLGDQQWLIDLERSGLHRVVPASNDGIGSPREAPVSSPAGDSVRMKAAGSDPAVDTAPLPVSDTAPSNSDKTQIDLLVLYTPGLEAHYGGADQAKTHLQNLVALANQAYIDSDVKITLRLVGAEQVDAPDDSANMDTLVALTNGSDPYKNAAQLRTAHVADLVSVVRPFTMKQGGLCGLGWVGGSGGVSIAQAGNRAFSVVGDGSEGGYYCSNYTLSHELGHNMGSMHDHATVAKQNEGHGAYPYSFGYGVAGQFGTIMSYIDPEVGKFSNPGKTCGGQTACGVADGDNATAADNARSLNDARRFVAAYRQVADGQDQSIAIAGVITLQGSALSGVQITASSSANCVETGSNGSFSCIVPAGWTGNITPTLSGYTFDPPTLAVSNVNSDIADQNFTAVPSTTAGAGARSNSGGGGGSIGLIGLAVLASFAGSRLQGRR